MSVSTSTPDQVRLPGQAAAPEGPVDLIMMYVMHHGFRRDLAAFAAAVPATPIEDHQSWQALLDRWTQFATVLHHHHSGEDEGLWPLLLQRVDAVGDDHGRATLEAMEAEHDQIDPLLSGCAAGFRRMASGGTADDRAALAVRTAAARDALGAHLAHEETDAMPLVQRHLTNAEWLQVEEDYFKGKQKLGDLLFGIPWACDGLPVEIRERAFDLFGLPFRVLWALTRRRFARADAVAFRHA